MIGLRPARELAPRALIRIPVGGGLSRDLLVLSVERAVDAIDRERRGLLVARHRPEIRRHAERVLQALDAVDVCGREALLVRVAGEDAPRAFAAGERVDVYGWASPEDLERATA